MSNIGLDLEYDYSASDIQNLRDCLHKVDSKFGIYWGKPCGSKVGEDSKHYQSSSR